MLRLLCFLTLNSPIVLRLLRFFVDLRTHPLVVLATARPASLAAAIRALDDCAAARTIRQSPVCAVDQCVVQISATGKLVQETVSFTHKVVLLSLVAP